VHTPLLSCADPLRPTTTDPHFAAETRAARSLGAETALIDHDALLAGDARAAVRRVPRGFGAAWYRGWMIPAARYGELAAALAERDAGLIVSPEAYRRAHELPGWYSVFADRTPASVWADGVPDVRPLGPGAGIVKDYVKSRKHDWDTACFVPDLADRGGLSGVVDAFRALQGEFLAGGIVVRVFERFVGPETRVWWLDGQPIFAGRHPDTPDATVTPDLSGIAELVAKLDCRFVTTDLVRRADGAWRVVEVGDGQVSDRPGALEPDVLIGALLAA
jgi:hypothetical protein